MDITGSLRKRGDGGPCRDRTYDQLIKEAFCRSVNALRLNDKFLGFTARTRNIKPRRSNQHIAYDAAPHSRGQYRDVALILRKLFFLGVFSAFIAACGGGASQVTQAPLISNVVAFMGDSITLLFEPLLATEPFDTVNFGVGGQTTTDMLARFKHDVIDAQPAVGVVVIDGGVNDFQLDYSGAPVTIDNIVAMADMAHEAGIRVIIASVMLSHYSHGNPVIPTAAQIQQFNDQLIDLCAANGYIYADYYDVMLLPDGTEDFSLYTDGLHPNAAGYAKMWAVIEPLLNEALQ